MVARRAFRLALLSILLVGLLFGSGLLAAGATTSPMSAVVPPPGVRLLPISSASGYAPSGAKDEGPLLGPSPILVSVALSLPPDPTLSSFETALNTPGSPEYHHFLDLEQFDVRFGPSASDVGSLLSYFEARGLVLEPDGGPLIYTLQGTPEEFDSAFHTQIEEYATGGGREEFAPASPPSLPSGLESLVGSIDGLDQFDRPTPTLDPVPARTATTVITPTVMRGFYNSTNLLASGDTGSYYAIGLAEMCDPLEPKTTTFSSDLASFDNMYALPVANVVYLDTGATSCTQGYPGWGEETDLDMQWAHAMAPGATLYVCLDNSDPDNCDQMFVANQSAFNVEFGSNSFGWIGPDHAVWAAADAAGMTLLAAAGDKCAGVVYPSAEPDGLGVGGTAITPSGNAFGSETAWSCTGSGSNKEGTGGGCDTSDAPPSYQTLMSGYPGPCTSSDRGVPDVGMDASPNTGVDLVYDGTVTETGGTSLSCPMWAATLDLIYQNASAGGFAAPTIYSLAESANYPHLFHEITTGNNGYAAGPGWNPDTGVGTPNIGALASAWPKGGGSGGRATVTFAVSPAGSGSIVFNGTTFYDGASVSVLPGNYTFGETTNPWSTFSTWSTSGGLSISGGTGKVWVKSTGGLTATFSPKATVLFSVDPTSCASSVDFNGSAVPTSGTYALGAGYAADAGICSSEIFSGWTASLGVSVASPSSASTTVSLSGNGTLNATYSSAVSSFTVSVQVASPGDGWVVLAGQPLYNGGTLSLAAGSYPLSSSANVWARFSAWSATGGTAISSGQLVVSGSGTLTASFSSLFSVGFSVNESACAPLYFNGSTSEASGATAWVPQGGYALRSDSCDGFSFEGWTSTGGVAASPSGANETDLQVTGNGTVEGLFDPAAVAGLYAVQVFVRPATCPSLTIGGSSYSNGTTAELAAGSYALSPSSCSGYEPSIGFEVAGGVSVNGAGTVATVEGDGSITALYTPQGTPTLKASLAGPGTGSVGSPLSFSASFSGGVPPYDVTWIFGDGSKPQVVSGVQGSSATGGHAFLQSGTFEVAVFVNDSGGRSVSATTSVQVSTSSSSSNGGGNGGGGGLSPSLLELLVVAAVAVLVTALVAVVLLRRKRGGSPPPLPEGEGVPAHAWTQEAATYLPSDPP